MWMKDQIEKKKNPARLLQEKAKPICHFIHEWLWNKKWLNEFPVQVRGNQVATNLLFLILDNLTGLKAGEKFFVYKCTGLSLALLYSLVH